MKLQVAGRSIRIRLDEAGLAGLLATGACTDATPLGPNATWRRTLRLVDAPEAGFTRTGDDWEFTVPRAAFAAFARERPRRDGFLARLDAGVELAIEVDVRDSRKRLAATGSAAGETLQAG
jgi:hypothetical protein